MTLAPGGSESEAIVAGRVGRAHGLDGSFYVTGARPRLLGAGTVVVLERREHTIVRRAGTDERPIVRLQDIEDRAAVESLRGRELTVAREHAPSLGAEEWWGAELEGCEVTDGDRLVGVVRALVELPSCEALEVDRCPLPAAAQDLAASDEQEPLLVPMVADAIRSIDVHAKRIDVDMSFVEGD